MNPIDLKARINKLLKDAEPNDSLVKLIKEINTVAFFSKKNISFLNRLLLEDVDEEYSNLNFISKFITNLKEDKDDQGVSTYKYLAKYAETFLITLRDVIENNDKGNLEPLFINKEYLDGKKIESNILAFYAINIKH